MSVDVLPTAFLVRDTGRHDSSWPTSRSLERPGVSGTFRHDALHDDQQRDCAGLCSFRRRIALRHRSCKRAVKVLQMERALCRVPILLIGALAFCVAAFPAVGAESNLNLADDPDALVLRLKELPEHLEAAPPYNAICSGEEPCPVPPLPPLEAERHRMYNELYALGPAGVAALARGLASSDAQLRRNVAVALGALAVGWIRDPYLSRMDISAALPALMTALEDSDQHVRAYAAFDLGDMGSKAAPAVGRLIETLGDPDEYVRHSVCSALGGIGPAAKAALPALRQALADPSEHVRASAQLAIPRIEGRLRAPGERDPGAPLSMRSGRTLTNF